jgi:SEC-C motif-containing protein
VPPPRDCPCHSKKRYAACCGPYHRGEASAPTATALMRSRYAGFALGLGDYLLSTLASAHPDHSGTDAAELGGSRKGQRFMDLCILHESETGDAAEVLFYARLFERGIDQSFVELSQFVREGGAWRYQSGTLVPATDVTGDPRKLTLSEFTALGGKQDATPKAARDC